NRTLSITLDSAAASGGVEMYLGAGTLPTPADFVASSQNGFQPDQLLTLPHTEAGTYYLLVRAVGGAVSTAPYTLTATIPGFKIQRISPVVGGNNGQVTMTIEGAGFTPIGQVSLIADNS